MILLYSYWQFLLRPRKKYYKIYVLCLLKDILKNISTLFFIFSRWKIQKGNILIYVVLSKSNLWGFFSLRRFFSCGKYLLLGVILSEFVFSDLLLIIIMLCFNVGGVMGNL